jgi:hypothetical protein
MAQGYYEVHVVGTLPPEALIDFECLKLSPQPVQSVLRGPLCCQAALLWLLGRLESFRIPVIEVRRVRDSPSPEDEVTIMTSPGIPWPET